jgi:hypothetical protein
MSLRAYRPVRFARDPNWVRRAEDSTAMTAANDLALRRASEAAGVEFIDENGGGPGVQLKKSSKKRT